VSEDFFLKYIAPYTGIIAKLCRAYTNNQEDFEDYYQEVCLQIWKNHSNFKNQSKWSTWVYKITLNVCMCMLRKEKSTYTGFLPEPNEVQNTAFKNENVNLLYDAIKKLNEVDKAVILLYLEEKSYKEIAQIMGTNFNTIGVRINRIKERLKILLNETNH